MHTKTTEAGMKRAFSRDSLELFTVFLTLSWHGLIFVYSIGIGDAQILNFTTDNPLFKMISGDIDSLSFLKEKKNPSQLML